MWLLLLVLITNQPTQSGDLIKFGLPEHWWASEAACNAAAGQMAQHYSQGGAHVAFLCYQPPPHEDAH
jgi:hypothetical protein